MKNDFKVGDKVTVYKVYEDSDVFLNETGTIVEIDSPLILVHFEKSDPDKGWWHRETELSPCWHVNERALRKASREIELDFGD